MYIVTAGNPFDGLTTYGPFSSALDANEWASHALKDEDWWVTDIQNVDVH